MTTIAFRFPAGRYHATPWGRHVNEGDVEWPPSPWRLLRALLAVGFTKRAWNEVPEDARQLIEKLAGEVPSYRLPRGVAAHTRHYMPLRKGTSESTTKVVDAFVRFDDPQQELLIQYSIDLDDGDRELLDNLLAGLGYLGRAESWVEGRLLDQDPVPDGPDWCRLMEPEDTRPETGDAVSVLAPVPAEEYVDWRINAVEQALAARQAERGKPPTKADRRKIAEAHPPDLVHCLLAVTGDLQKQGWNRPPGSRTLLYDRPAGLLETRPARLARRRSPGPTPQAALLALASDRETKEVLPLIERSLPQMELLHQSLVSILGDEAPKCPVLTGRDPETGRPLGGRHVHATYIPLDLSDDGRLDHVFIHAPMGLDARALRALRKLRRTWTKGEERDLIVTLAGAGSIDDFQRQLRLRSGAAVPELATERVWISVTPFIPPRHMKKRRHTVEDQARDQLRKRGFPPPAAIEILARDELVRRRLLRFVRARKPGKPKPPANAAFGLRIWFDQPVQGPIAIGYASHYGLGVFAAERPVTSGSIMPSHEQRGRS